MKKVTLTYAFASALTILMGLAQAAHAQAPALELRTPALSPDKAVPSVAPSLRIDALRDEGRRIDLASPALLTALGGVAVVGGLATALVELLGWSLSGFYAAELGGRESADAQEWILAGLAIAAAGAALLAPSAIWLRTQTRRARAIRREIRDLEEGIAIGLGPTGITVRGTF